MRKTVYLALMLFTCASFAQNLNLSVSFEELTSPDFVKAVEKSKGVCIIPLGIMEKHGSHLPLGTDLIAVRDLALKAAGEEYAIVFPPYYFGQIFEAKHQPGTIAYSSGIIWKLLQETCDELARNGIKKIVLINGHGGNTSFLQYFVQTQLEEKRDYAVYLYSPALNPKLEEVIKNLKKSALDYHAGEEETSCMLAVRPDLVKMSTVKKERGNDLGRLKNMSDNYSAIWWYARFPNHYAGDASAASVQLGELINNNAVKQFAVYLKSVKEDKNVLRLQNIFFEESSDPLKTLPKE